MPANAGRRDALRPQGSLLRAWQLATLVIVALGLAVDSGYAQTPRRVQTVCAECHQNIDATYDRALLHSQGVTCLTCHHLGLTNDAAKIAARRSEVCSGCHPNVSATHTAGHAGRTACTACHSIHADASPMKGSLASARCQKCHERPHVLHANVAKSARLPNGAQAPECTSCHTVHGDRGVRAGYTSVTATCVSCHRQPHPSHPPAGNRTVACTACHSLASDSAAAAVPTGAALSAVCVSCHKKLPAAHAASHSADRQRVPECGDCHSFAHDEKMPRASATISRRCTECHERQNREYRAGGHAEGLAAGQPNRDLPNCVTCHVTHAADSSARAVRVAGTDQCIRCHSNRKLAEKYGLPVYAAASYTQDFHGKTFTLIAKQPAAEGQPDVMTCSDCHGAHAVAWRDDAKVADVCVRCHQNGGAKLASAWLGHSKPGPTSQPLVWLIRLFYYVVIPFVLAGLALHIAFQLIDQRRKGARMLDTLQQRRARKALPAAMVTRFSRSERLEHLGSMITFILLVITGLPQTRPNLAIAQKTIEWFGGITTLRWVHRGTGLIFVALLLQHVTRAVLRAIRTRRLPVMVTTRRDFRDALETVRHFIWGTPRPKTGKFDFSEKFEYWGLFMGGTLMSGTGLALLFPELITQYLPGLFVAAFRVMHGLEATFAVLVVALWHSYGVILRPQVFPLDTSIFTGQISVERLEEEHELEYERLFPDGHTEPDDSGDAEDGDRLNRVAGVC